MEVFYNIAETRGFCSWEFAACLERQIKIWSMQSSQELLDTKKPATKLSQYKMFHSVVLYKGSSKLELTLLKEDNF